jgi:hypothetical protein
MQCRNSPAPAIPPAVAALLFIIGLITPRIPAIVPAPAQLLQRQHYSFSAFGMFSIAIFSGSLG